MNVKMKMPDLGTTVDEIKIIKWLVNVGDSVKRGQALVEVETDKATTEVESFTAGKVVEICVPEDTEAVAGDVIAVIEVEG